MRKRSRSPQTEADAAELGLHELNTWISGAEFRALHLKAFCLAKAVGNETLGVARSPTGKGFTVCLPPIEAQSDFPQR
ncbi:hypothetical protein [Bradyrhizobium sp. JR3.5]